MKPEAKDATTKEDHELDLYRAKIISVLADGLYMYHCVNAVNDRRWMVNTQINGSVHNISRERAEEARAHEVNNRLIPYMCDIGLETK